MIDASGNAGVQARRQVFFVSLGGFDTHDTQNRNHADLMAKLAHALSYFDTTLGAMGARKKVTTFTASDFGRSFTSNGDGTDHGWGAHHFVMGGAVRGGDLYGNFPILGTKNANNNGFDSSPNQLDNGALLPETSVDQLAATLGRWFGLSDGQLADAVSRTWRTSTSRSATWASWASQHRTAVLQRLGHMRRGDGVGARQVGDGARHLQGAVQTAAGPAQAQRGGLQELRGRLVERAQRIDLCRLDRRIRQALALRLPQRARRPRASPPGPSFRRRPGPSARRA